MCDTCKDKSCSCEDKSVVSRRGITGPAGPKGSKGETGPSGNSILCGETNPSESIGGCGDVYLDTVTGDFYAKDEFCVWQKKGNLKGPAGLTSGEGVPTEDGTYCDEVYVDLLTGLTYTWNCETEEWDAGSGTGFQGPQGETGPEGPEGPEGPQGASGDPAEVAFDGWKTLALNGDWATYPGSSSNYTKNGSGMTLLRGLVNVVVVNPVFPSIYVIDLSDYLLGTLPSGYRPSLRQRFVLSYSRLNGGGISSDDDNSFMTGFVDTNGEIRISELKGATSTPDTEFIFDLSGIIFWAEN